jgi:hypothetical protein
LKKRLQALNKPSCKSCNPVKYKFWKCAHLSFFDRITGFTGLLQPQFFHSSDRRSPKTSCMRRGVMGDLAVVGSDSGEFMLFIHHRGTEITEGWSWIIAASDRCLKKYSCMRRGISGDLAVVGGGMVRRPCRNRSGQATTEMTSSVFCHENSYGPWLFILTRLQM